MSDDCTLDLPGDRLDPAVTRRTVLGGGIALGALAAGQQPARAGSTGPRQQRNIRLHRFDDAAAFAAGTHEQGATRLDGAQVVLTEGRTEGTWTSPTLTPGFGATELIASWNADTPSGSWITVTVSGRTTGGVAIGEFTLGKWCADNPEQGGAIRRTSVADQSTAHASVSTDTLVMASGETLQSFAVSITLHRQAAGGASPRVALVGALASAVPAGEVSTSTPGAACGTVLDVPPLSQEIHVGHYPEWDNGGEAWCSPTAVSMVADFWSHGPSAEDIAWVDIPPDEQVDHAARQTYDHAYEGCGNWPFNAAYAATLGLRGFITRLRSLAEAEQFIAAGIPLVLSVAFEKDELDGAGYSTNGHLMVLVGFDSKGNPVMNDPASHLIPDNDEVRVTYRRDQMENVWLPHSGGIVYVIHTPETALPKALPQANW